MVDTATPVGAIRLLIEEEIEKVPFRPYVLLANTRRTDEFQNTIKWNANVGGAAVQGRATTANASTGTKSTTAPANLSIGGRVLGHSFSVLRNDIVQAQRTAPGALRNLFLYHVQEAFDIILEELNITMYDGDGTDGAHGIFGLEGVTAATSYAGIASGTYADWASTVQANGGTPRALTKTLLDALDVAVKRKGVMYDGIYCPPELIKKYEDLFNTERSLTVNQGVPDRADVGFSGHSYGGIPIFEDIHCPDETMYFMDSRKVELKTYNLGSSQTTDATGRVIGTQANSQKTMGINFLIAELPANNPHAIDLEISVQPQLMVRQPKCVAKLGDLTQ